MKVKNCKLKNAIVCEETDSVEKIAKKMKESREKYVLVVSKKNKNDIIGVISVTDLVYKVIAMARDSKGVIAKEVMNFPVYAIDIEDSVAKAYFGMVSRNIFYCPVMSKGKIAGILMLNEAFNQLVRIAKAKIKER